MRAYLITVGDELLSGRTINSNAACIGSELAAAGAPLVGSCVVGDDERQIISAVQRAVADHDIVMVTGGLGPTPDDITLDALARALDLKLSENALVLEAIRERYRRVDRAIPAAVERMARIPDEAEVLSNDWGAAPGLHVRRGGCHIFVLPGVPREAEGILRHSVLPRIKAMPDLKRTYARGLATAGVPESTLADRISDLLPPADSGLKVAFLPNYGGVEVRISTQGDPAEVDAVADRVRERLGPAYVSEAEGDDLVRHVSANLKNRGETLATAESCTGGLLGKLLTDLPGSSTFYQGGIVAYSNAIKERHLRVARAVLVREGAVSPETAAAMAAGARTAFDATYALAITGIAGPGGGTPEKPVGLIYLGIAAPGGTAVRRLNLTTDRGQNRLRAAYAALDFLRRHLAGHIGVK